MVHMYMSCVSFIHHILCSQISTVSSLCNLGFLRSAPISTVFLPEIAKTVARFIEQKVFPSPPLVDVTLIIFLSFSELMYWILVLKDLNDSDNTDFDFFIMRFESSELLPINAKIGTLVLFVISDFVCIELLKKSFSDKYKIGTNKVLKRARKYIKC